MNGVFRLLAFRNGRELQNEWTFESGIPGIIGVLGIIGKVAAGNKMAAILNGVFRLLAFRNGRELQNEWTFESGVPGIVGDYREGGRQKSRWRPF
ncbi:hypothetical protein [uncultured Dialister sp.]|uniref:hypothetical protein n=1 Tax=uncultured Dialister sp. TaxID=278064 RepID=UPI0025FF25D4|nr:hypothetical protein [uncultured Dialister sp.]